MAKTQKSPTPNVAAAVSANSPAAPGILSFIGNLLTNSVFLGTGRSATTALRGSLAGLASGIDALVAKRNAPNGKRGPAILIVGGYVLAGLAAALVYRSMRRPAAR